MIVFPVVVMTGVLINNQYLVYRLPVFVRQSANFIKGSANVYEYTEIYLQK